MESITTPVIMATSAWFGNKLLGPTIEAVGNDIKQLYEKGRDKIVANAIKKTKNIDSKGQTNLRVTRDIFWNGSFTDESICAEYFGGILAASRSEDGKDDSGVFYVDIIKSMPSDHLRMHYIIYRTLNKELITNTKKKALNPASGIELNREKLFFRAYTTIEEFKNKNILTILTGLYAKGLINHYLADNHEPEGGIPTYYFQVNPNPLGVQLFAIANNMLGDWLNFSKSDFGDFDDVTLPEYYAQSLEGLEKKIELNNKKAAFFH